MLAISGGSGGGLLGTGFSSGHGGLDGAPRGLSALHKRADQLKQWEEREAVLLKAESNEPKPPSGPKIKFSNKTLFLASCAIGDYDECKRLLTSNLVDINDCNIDGLTALHQACIDDNLEMVKFLIEHGADVNCSDNEGWTPLHATASCGHTDIVEVLLENGANPCITNNDGELAIDIAENDTIEDLIKSKMRALGVDDFEFLRKQEQFVMMQDVQEWLKTGIVDDKRHPRSGATILHVAASKGYINIMETILNNRNLRSQIDIDACDNEGWTPLHAACYFQHAGAVEILLRHGASIDKKTSMGQSLRELTDHELILSLIAERKKKLAEEQKLKDQLSNGPPPKTVPPSPPSAPTPPTESETQRKAHAKRARETRRSTQGISADDVNRAKDQLKQVNEPSSEVEKPQEKSALTTNEDQVDNQRPSTPTSSLVSSTDNSCEPSSPESSLPLDQGVHLVRRRRPKRRSTGVNSYDGVKGETNESPDESSKPQTPEPVSPVSSTTITPLAASSTALTSPLIRTEANNSHNRVLNNKSLNDNEENKYPTASTTSTGANTRSRSSSKQSLKEVENAEKDWKKLYEDLQQQYDHLKKEFTKKEQDWSREKRHMQRKISELEEECKQLENYRNDNQRLKDENGALIRVISKLSK